MHSEAVTQVRAWVDYYRDLGTYDFYRRGEPAPLPLEEDSQVQPHPAWVSPAVAEEPPPMIEVRAEADLLAVLPPQLSGRSAVSSNKLISFDSLSPAPGTSLPATARPAALLEIREDIGDCTRCPLAYAGRSKIVFGDGSPTARVMFVGEGPGAEEDAQGIPFVGKAGHLLNNMIAAMGLARADVYIANIVKCRPPANRVPEPIEANTCSPFLLRQIDVVQPQVIVALGSTAATYLLGVKQPLSALRGRWHVCRGAKLAVTYHPAFLLRDPRQKAEAWKDLQRVMEELHLPPPSHR